MIFNPPLFVTANLTSLPKTESKFSTYKRNIIHSYAFTNHIHLLIATSVFLASACSCVRIEKQTKVKYYDEHLLHFTHSQDKVSQAASIRTSWFAQERAEMPNLAISYRGSHMHVVTTATQRRTIKIVCQNMSGMNSIYATL